MQVEKTVQGTPLSGRITAAVLQHTAMTSSYMKAIRFMVLEPIEDPDQRKKLRADFYLKEASPPQQMFCSSYNPEDVGLKTEQTYVSQTLSPPNLLLRGELGIGEASMPSLRQDDLAISLLLVSAPSDPFKRNRRA